MKIIRTKTMDRKLKNDLLSFKEQCKTQDKNIEFLPIDDDATYYLLYEEDCLLSALSTFFLPDEGYECYAITHPKYRQKGLFSKLFQTLQKDSEDYDIIFPVSNLCQDTLNTLGALNAELWYQEHLMELILSSSVKPTDKNTNHFSLNETTLPDGSVKYEFKQDKTTLGSCCLTIQEHSSFLSSFEIKEEFRNQGMGQIFLSLFLSTYHKNKKNKPDKICLQVSGENKPALSLYQKKGFQIIETITYYLYESLF